MNLFAFGLGYCACDFISRHGARFATVAGTIRDTEKARALGKGSDITRFLFDGESDKAAIIAALDKADVLLDLRSARPFGRSGAGEIRPPHRRAQAEN